MITLVYFSFTSLTTVGLGDLHARSNAERIFQTSVLLMGVAAFSFVMNNFLNIVIKTKSVSAPFEQHLKLSKFLGLLRQFNAN